MKNQEKIKKILANNRESFIAIQEIIKTGEYDDKIISLRDSLQDQHEFIMMILGDANVQEINEELKREQNGSTKNRIS